LQSGKASYVSSIQEELKSVPGIKFVDHIAIAVKPGELDGHVKAYEMLGFREIHREDVLGNDQVREVLLEVGGGPNLIQLLEPLTPESPVQKLIDRNGGRGGFAHVAFRVESAQKAFDAMKSNGFRSSMMRRVRAHEAPPSFLFIPNPEPKIRLGSSSKLLKTPKASEDQWKANIYLTNFPR
jgi:methylmalonyl-CoA/ethylmalonyl-CoA epimerase